MLEDANLAEHFRTIQQLANLPQGDFPQVQNKLAERRGRHAPPAHH